MWAYFSAGLLAGWLAEWIFDWMFWRKRAPGMRGASGASSGAGSASADDSLPLSAAARTYRDEDLEAIEGIGPLTAELLRAGEIRSLAALAQAEPIALQRLLAEAGPRFRLANPASWIEQASLAARNDWVAFDRLKREMASSLRNP